MSSAKLILSSHLWKEKKAKKQIISNNSDTYLWSVAKKELREDDHTREQCLQQFKEWIKKNEDLENCLTDDAFLLRFLRAKKFSLPISQQTLLKYLNLRRCFKHIFYNLDYLDSKIYEIITSGYIFASPFRDGHGRRVIITTGNKFDPNKYDSTDMARVHVITYETLLDDRDNQILGFTHVGDVANSNASLVTMWSIAEFARLIRWGEQSYPMRHKEMHVLNIPIAFKYVYDFGQSLVSQKLRDRCFLYNRKEELHKKIDLHVLPAEYGGIMSMAEMIELWKQELASKRERLLSLDKMTLISDRGIISRRHKIGQDVNALQGSFRKLEVD